MKKWCLVMLAICILSGCGVQTQDEKRLKDLDFTVLDPEKIPEELRDVLEEKKEQPFKVTYEDLYQTSNAVCVVTELLGPGNGEEAAEATTCPYIVLKMESMDLSVVFK